MGWVRAGESRVASQGVGEAVWLGHTTGRQRRMAVRISPDLRVGPARGRKHYAKRNSIAFTAGLCNAGCSPLQAHRGPNPKPDSLLPPQLELHQPILRVLREVKVNARMVMRHGAPQHLAQQGGLPHTGQ